jgi:putative flippase GtrA
MLRTIEIIKTASKIQIIKFILVGLLCALIEYFSFYVFIKQLYINYLIANILSIVIAVSINYYLSALFVFDPSKRSRIQEFFYFAFFSFLALVLNQLILFVLVELIILDVQIGKALAIGSVALFNYLTKKYIVFKPVQKE